MRTCSKTFRPSLFPGSGASIFDVGGYAFQSLEVPMPGTLHAHESEEVAPVDHLRWLRQYVAEAHVQPERHAVRFPRELPLHAEAQALVDHAVAFDRGMLAIGLNLEGQEVPEVEASRAPQLSEEAIAGAAKVDVHVTGGSCSFEAKLESNTALGHGAISQMLKDAGEEPVVDEHLAKATHAARARRCPDPLLQGLTKAFRGGVASRRHVVPDGCDGDRHLPRCGQRGHGGHPD